MDPQGLCRLPRRGMERSSARMRGKDRLGPGKQSVRQAYFTLILVVFVSIGSTEHVIAQVLKRPLENLM